jgi:hypothetical protein
LRPSTLFDERYGQWRGHFVPGQPDCCSTNGSTSMLADEVIE